MTMPLAMLSNEHRSRQYLVHQRPKAWGNVTPKQVDFKDFQGVEKWILYQYNKLGGTTDPEKVVWGTMEFLPKMDFSGICWLVEILYYNQSPRMETTACDVESCRDILRC